MPATERQTRSDRARQGAHKASSAELASYIQDMVGQMERLAAGPDFAALRALLRRASEEAGRHAQE